MSITDKDYIPTKAEAFIIRRIQEFPTLYRDAYAVIMAVINGRGGPSWTADGTIENTDQYYNSETEKYTSFPLRISEEVARSFYLEYLFRMLHIPSWGEQYKILDNIPDNIEESWLEELRSFLLDYAKLTEEDIVYIATAKQYGYSGKFENEMSGQPARDINTLRNFVKRVPSWIARLGAISYERFYGKPDPAVFMGIDI